MVFFFFLSRLFFFRFVSGDGLLLLLIEALLLSLLLLRVKTSEEFRRRTLSLVEAEAHLRELGARLELRALRHGRRPRGPLAASSAWLKTLSRAPAQRAALYLRGREAFRRSSGPSSASAAAQAASIARHVAFASTVPVTTHFFKRSVSGRDQAGR